MDMFCSEGLFDSVDLMVEPSYLISHLLIYPTNVFYIIYIISVLQYAVIIYVK